MADDWKEKAVKEVDHLVEVADCMGLEPEALQIGPWPATSLGAAIWELMLCHGGRADKVMGALREAARAMALRRRSGMDVDALDRPAFAVGQCVEARGKAPFRLRGAVIRWERYAHKYEVLVFGYGPMWFDEDQLRCPDASG